jgi:protein-tyrosine-phosphatase
MAEGLLKDRSQRLLEGAIRIRSVGTWARPESPPMPEAVQAVAERGVDISSLRAEALTPRAVEVADVVITMTAQHRDEVLHIVPEAAPKTFTLKELVDLLERLPGADGPPSPETAATRIAKAHRVRGEPGHDAVTDEDVADPLGLGVETYRAVAWELEGLVDRLIEGLFGNQPAARIAAGEA